MPSVSNYPGAGIILTDLWYINQLPATATVATATKAAGAAGVRHVMLGATISVATGANAQPGIAVNIRDGATGAGTILFSVAVSCIANTCYTLVLPFSAWGYPLFGTAATAMTIEFAVGGTIVAIAQAAVSAWGYDAT